MGNKSVKDAKQQSVKALRERLNWLVNESVEDSNREEINAIRKLLNIMEPDELDTSYYNPEKGFERFMETLEIRMRIQDEMRRTQAGEVSLADYPDDNIDVEPTNIVDIPESKPIKKRIDFKSKYFYRVTIAASLVAMLFIGGVVGVYAQQRGFIGTVIDCEEKDFIVSTQTFDNKQMVYDNIQNVPLKYISCLWTPTNIPKEMELKRTILIETEATIKTNCEYKNENNNEFIIAKKNNYKDSAVLTDQLHDGFKAYKKETYDDIVVEYLVKENDDYTEYIASFVYDDCVYNLNSNCHFDIIKDIIEKSISSRNL